MHRECSDKESNHLSSLIHIDDQTMRPPCVNKVIASTIELRQQISQLNGGLQSFVVRTNMAKLDIGNAPAVQAHFVCLHGAQKFSEAEERLRNMFTWINQPEMRPEGEYFLFAYWNDRGKLKLRAWLYPMSAIGINNITWSEGLVCWMVNRIQNYAESSGLLGSTSRATLKRLLRAYGENCREILAPSNLAVSFGVECTA